MLRRALRLSGAYGHVPTAIPGGAPRGNISWVYGAGGAPCHPEGHNAPHLKEWIKPNGRDIYKYKLANFGINTLLGGTLVHGLRAVLAIYVCNWTRNAASLAAANLEIDTSNIAAGTTIVIEWQGKPIFIRHRTEKDVADARNTPLSKLRDPAKDEDRVQREDFFVGIAICTHLGCVPVPGQGDYGAYFCPCHGSHYDHSGRIRKGPAPLNLTIPPYKFIDDNTLFLGDPSKLEK